MRFNLLVVLFKCYYTESGKHGPDWMPYIPSFRNPPCGKHTGKTNHTPCVLTDAGGGLGCLAVVCNADGFAFFAV